LSPYVVWARCGQAKTAILVLQVSAFPSRKGPDRMRFNHIYVDCLGDVKSHKCSFVCLSGLLLTPVISRFFSTLSPCATRKLQDVDIRVFERVSVR